MSRPSARVAFWFALLALCLSYLVHLNRLGLGFPVPWPDEASFLWQAIAVQETNSLLAPQLNPARPLMWMPPGYMVVQGLIFKVTGFSLEWARALSALYLCGTVAFFGTLLQMSPARWLHLVLTAVFLHSPIFLLAGNTARMEPLVVLLAAGSLVLIHSSRLWPGLALAMVAPLVHPNGAYFALGAAGYATVRLMQQPSADRNWLRGALWLSVPALLWALYGVYAISHWEYFLVDMRFQWALHQGLNYYGGGLGRALQLQHAIPALWLAGLAWYSWRRRNVLAPLIAFAIPANVLTLTSLGFMYDIYTALEYFVIGVMTIHVVGSEWPVSQLRPLAIGATTLVLAIAGNDRLRSPEGLTVSVSYAIAPISDRSGPAYYEPDDVKAVRAYLDSLHSPERPLLVQFDPSGDALLFHDAEGAGFRFSKKTFHQSLADVYIVHESRYLSGSHRNIIMNSLSVEEGVPMPVSQWTPIHNRDTSERWVTFRRER